MPDDYAKNVILVNNKAGVQNITRQILPTITNFPKVSLLKIVDH